MLRDLYSYADNVHNLKRHTVVLSIYSIFKDLLEIDTTNNFYNPESIKRVGYTTNITRENIKMIFDKLNNIDNMLIPMEIIDKFKYMYIYLGLYSYDYRLNKTIFEIYPDEFFKGLDQGDIRFKYINPSYDKTSFIINDITITENIGEFIYRNVIYKDMSDWIRSDKDFSVFCKEQEEKYGGPNGFMFVVHKSMNKEIFQEINHFFYPLYVELDNHYGLHEFLSNCEIIKNRLFSYKITKNLYSNRGMTKINEILLFVKNHEPTTEDFIKLIDVYINNINQYRIFYNFLTNNNMMHFLGEHELRTIRGNSGNRINPADKKTSESEIKTHILNHLGIYHMSNNIYGIDAIEIYKKSNYILNELIVLKALAENDNGFKELYNTGKRLNSSDKPYYEIMNNLFYKDDSLLLNKYYYANRIIKNIFKNEKFIKLVDIIDKNNVIAKSIIKDINDVELPLFNTCLIEDYENEFSYYILTENPKDLIKQTEEIRRCCFYQLLNYYSLTKDKDNFNSLLISYKTSIDNGEYKELTIKDFSAWRMDLINVLTVEEFKHITNYINNENYISAGSVDIDIIFNEFYIKGLYMNGTRLKEYCNHDDNADKYLPISFIYKQTIKYEDIEYPLYKRDEIVKEYMDNYNKLIKLYTFIDSNDEKTIKEALNEGLEIIHVEYKKQKNMLEVEMNAELSEYGNSPKSHINYKKIKSKYKKRCERCKKFKTYYEDKLNKELNKNYLIKLRRKIKAADKKITMI